MLEIRWEKFLLQYAPRRTKIAYTGFLLYLLLGLITIVAIEAMKTGWTPQGVCDYYRGNEARFMYEKTPLEMLEVSHMHLFSIPVVFFVLGHAFFMTTLREKMKLQVVLASFAAVLFSIGSPWFIRFFSPAFSWVKVASDLVLAASLLVMVLYPIYEMWWKPPAPFHKKLKAK